MKYADLKLNDIVDCREGIVVSLWMQGCPFRCKGCHNPQTWDFDGGKEIAEEELVDRILTAINANGIKRGFAVLGGEPLCEQNAEYVDRICEKVREAYPDIEIYIWTGYTFEHIDVNTAAYRAISRADYVVEGPFIESLRNIRLKMRGSTNQRVFKKINGIFKDITNEIDSAKR